MKVDQNIRVEVRGFNFWHLLGLLLIALRLTGHIDWSWLWVLMPLVGWTVIKGMIILFEDEDISAE